MHGTINRPTMRGATFIELIFALAIVGVTAMVQIQQVTVTLRDYHEDLDAQFATRKATGMLAEIQASVDQGNILTTADVDALADASPNATLTTRFASAPDHVMSGNVRNSDGSWQWSRCITAEPVPGADRSRYVTVRVMRNNGHGQSAVMGVAAGIFSLTVRAEPYVQEFDVYVLAIAEAPSLWQPLPALRAQVQALADDVTGANPNLRLRLHWITKLGYGRDPLYVPYVNQAEAADTAAPWVYWYPGKLGAGSTASSLYSAELISGRVRTEAGVLHDYHPDDNPYPHAVADRNNHCLRTPEARDLFALRVAAGVEQADEPPLQLLLADMAEDPARFRNALFINLHGEGLPFPPLRNYADAAKDPVAHPGLRVVTHPARLHTRSGPGGPPVEFRVYSYMTTPPTDGNGVIDAITIQLFGGDFRTAITVDCQPGGVDVATGQLLHGLDHRYATATPPKTTDPHQPFEMHYEVGYATTPAPHTWVRLHNTPVACPADFWGRGLHADAWLYGTDYIPSPVVWSDSFYALSNTSGSRMPKNTARWRLRLPQAALTATFGASAMVTATTRIGTDMTTGKVWPTQHAPANISTTYAWWSASPDDVPITERYQFLGDPRHNPYLDLCADGASFPHGYNWWFDDLRRPMIDASSPWTCLDAARLADGFAGQVIDDAPRMLQVWREALQTCGGVFINPHGQVAGSVLLGGEIALPRDSGGLLPTAVRLHGSLFDLGDSVPWQLATAVPGRMVVVGPSFWAKPWLGELCGDAGFAGWMNTGNLATADCNHLRNTGLWTPLDLPWGTAWDQSTGPELGNLGASTWAQGSAAANLSQSYAGPADVELSTMSRDFLQRVGLSVEPALRSIWQIGLSDCAPPSPLRNYPELFPDQDTAELLSLGAEGRAGVAVRIASADHGAGYLMALADHPFTQAQHRALAYKALTLGLEAMVTATVSGLSNTPEPLPLLQITAPGAQQSFSNPGTITVRWDVERKWFDGRPHGSAVFAESNLKYLLLYQRTGEREWRHATDGSEVTASSRSDPTHQLCDSGGGAESYLWSTPATRFPTGEYLLRVECTRGSTPTHSGRHEVRVVIKR